MLNRAALVVRPAQPFIDWAKSIEDDVVPGSHGEETVYLIPDYDDDGELDAILRRVHKEVFERELGGWYTDESLWPKRRTYAVFKKWFKIEAHSVIEDLCAYGLEDDGL